MRCVNPDGATPSSLTWDDDRWEAAPESVLPLTPVPLQSVDPSKYVRDAVSEESVGAVDAVRLRGIVNETAIALRLVWEDPSPDWSLNSGGDFADKAAVMFPLRDGASAMSMGSPEAPVNIWYWRADGSGPYDVLAQGMGTTERRGSDLGGLSCDAAHDGDRWHVVFRRPLSTADETVVGLDSRRSIGVALAVWEGSNRERGPLKAFSGEFRELVLRGCR